MMQLSLLDDWVLGDFDFEYFISVELSLVAKLVFSASTV
jgi:hypothetical protein